MTNKRQNDELKTLIEKAEAGDKDAQCNLGFLYEHSVGMETQYEEAIDWYQKSAKQGYDMAQLALGIMYYEGEGVDNDIVTAYAWFNVAAANENATAGKWQKILSEEMDEAQIDQALKIKVLG